MTVNYPFKSAAELLAHCGQTGLSISALMLENEKRFNTPEEIYKKLGKIWTTMREGIERGCRTEGVLAGPLRVPRRAAPLYRQLTTNEHLSNDPMSIVDWVNMFALAVSEENAAGGRVVTAPTNGAAGIIPAVLAYYDKFIQPVGRDEYTRFYLAAAAVGMLYKMNASISGAEVGCQGEVGVSCSMAAAGLTELMGGSPEQVCEAAEIGMEHNLGLTCHPVRRPGTGPLHRAQRHRRHEGGQLLPHGPASHLQAPCLPGQGHRDHVHHRQGHGLQVP